jgi:hypothetical protein
LRSCASVNPELERSPSSIRRCGTGEAIQGQVARKSEHAGGVLILPGKRSTTSSPSSAQGGQKGKLLSAFGERSGKGNALISDYGYTRSTCCAWPSSPSSSTPSI